tara:strand:- start:137 stop:589 length:453 start_codon:yes stop_codon:yes gene_type:complete
MIKVDVFVKDRNWKKYISNPSKYIKHKTKYLNSSLKIIKNKKINFSILLSGNREIKILNKKFRKKDKVTDVLSFPFYNLTDIKKLKKGTIYLGDVILNFYKIDKKNFKRDFNRLWVHGFVHLLGYRHHKDKDYFKMNRIEKLILNKIEGN